MNITTNALLEGRQLHLVHKPGSHADKPFMKSVFAVRLLGKWEQSSSRPHPACFCSINLPIVLLPKNLAALPSQPYLSTSLHPFLPSTRSAPISSWPTATHTKQCRPSASSPSRKMNLLRLVYLHRALGRVMSSIYSIKRVTFILPTVHPLLHLCHRTLTSVIRSRHLRKSLRP